MKIQIIIKRIKQKELNKIYKYLYIYIIFIFNIFRDYKNKIIQEKTIKFKEKKINDQKIYNKN